MLISNQVGNNPTTCSGISMESQLCSMHERLIDADMTIFWRQSRVRFRHNNCPQRISEWVFPPKNKDILLHKKSSNIQIREFNIDIYLLFNPQPIFKFCHCLSIVLYTYFLSWSRILSRLQDHEISPSPWTWDRFPVIFAFVHLDIFEE